MSLPATPTTQLQPQPPILPSNPPIFLNSTTATATATAFAAKPKNVSLKQFHNQVDPIVSWTSAIARHCQKGNLSEAANEFTRMRLSGIDPNHITFITLLSGCAHFPLQGKFFGAALHAYVRKLGLDKENFKLGTALVDMYSKCSLVEFARLSFDEISMKNRVSWNTMIDGYMRNDKVEEAVKLFDEMPERDVISWTAMINGFVKKGLDEKALEYFCEMQLSGVEPDYVTIIAVLAACANLGALNLGLWTNRFVMAKEFKDNIRLCNTLIDMYSRCGRVDFASEIFEQMPSRSLVSWNSMIGGFAANGHVEEALKFFDRMQREGFDPDGVTFTGVLTACSHAGLVDEGLKFFDDMKRVHKLYPRIEHYGCLVDLYSRAGKLEDALKLIKNMPVKPNEVVMGSLLAACRNCGDVGLAEMLMKYILEMDPGCDSNYVLLANMYAAEGSWEGAGKVRRKMKTRGIQKRPGISSIEIESDIHEFVAGDKFHSETDSIYRTLDLLSYEIGLCGYVPEAITKET